MEIIVISVLLGLGLTEGYEYATSCQSPATVEQVLDDGRKAMVPVCLDDQKQEENV